MYHRRTNKQKLRSRADKLWFGAVLLKYGDKCEVCGEQAVQAHHFFPKSLYPALRYDIDNGVPLCMKHHFLHHHRGDPSIHLAIISRRGKKWLAGLEKKKRDCVMWAVSFYEKTIARLEDFIKKHQE